MGIADCGSRIVESPTADAGVAFVSRAATPSSLNRIASDALAPAVSGPVFAHALRSKTAFVPGPKSEFSGRRIHFMGAGGIGVSALMELCLSRGAIVTGCDCSSGGQVPALRARGIRVETGHCSSHVADCDELVHTAAVDETHPEVLKARQSGKVISARMHMLGRI